MATTKKKAKLPSQRPLRSGPEILRDLDEELLKIDGMPMSKREAHLRLVYSRALKGDSRASLELQLVRDRCGAEDRVRKGGCLVVPEAISDDEWERLAFEQQRPFREGSYTRIES